MKHLLLALTLTAPLFGQTIKSPGVNGENINQTPFITALGGTTAGKALFQMTNPGAVRYLRVNADNTVSQLDAATFLSAIGGSSTVTWASLTGRPAAVDALTGTNTGDQAWEIKSSNFTAVTFKKYICISSLTFSFPSSPPVNSTVEIIIEGGTVLSSFGITYPVSAIPYTFRFDGFFWVNTTAVPNLNADNLTTGRVAIERLVNTQTFAGNGGTIAAGTRDAIITTAPSTTSSYYLPNALTSNGYPAGARLTFTDMSPNGLNPSVSANLRPPLGEYLNNVQNGNLVLSTPSASALLISDGNGKWNYDIRGVARGGTGATTLTGIVLGTGTLPLTAVATLPVGSGGTGLTSYTTGDILYASGSATLAKLPDVAIGSVLVSGGVGVAPAFSASPTLTGITFTGGGSLTASASNIALTLTAGSKLTVAGQSVGQESISASRLIYAAEGYRVGSGGKVSFSDGADYAQEIALTSDIFVFSRAISTTNLTASGSLAVTGTSTMTGTAIHGAAVRLKGYTVTTLPASPTQGDTAFVTDALTPTYLTLAVGGGAVVAPVIYNGSQWVTH